MPRPIAAGVLGMARTIAARGKLAARNCKVRPAMMDTTAVAPPTNGASVGMTSPATCGLTAITTAATSSTASRDGLRRRPRSRSAAISRLGCGSITAIISAASPSASQPSSMALPILPAPARRMVADRSARGRRFVCGFADELMTAPPAGRAGSSPQVGFTRLAALLKHAELGQARVPLGKSGLPDLRHSLNMRNSGKPEFRWHPRLKSRVGQARGRRERSWPVYACPWVSNMAASSASRAGLPAQTTN